MNIKTIENTGLDLSLWTLIKINHTRPLEGYLIQGFYSESYIATIGDGACTMARFYLNDIEIFRAWGLKEEEHCSFHAVRLKSSDMSSAQESCPPVSVKAKTKLQGVMTLVYNGENIEYPVSFVDN